jgi:dihydroorotase/N-acyl-D-amino-acid deacylase
MNERMFAESRDLYERYGYTPEFRTLDGYFKAFERRGASINLGSLVGSGGIRDFVIGKQDRRATPDELARMCALVDDAMRDGAMGLSSSLQYVPDIFNSTEELVAMAKVAARHGGVYFTHQRSESDRILASLDEVFRIAQEAGIRSQVWHLKTAYRPNFGRMPEILARIEEARARGIDVAANQYPWNRASNGLDACLPPWVREGGRQPLLKRLADPATRERVKADMEKAGAGWENQWLGAGGGEGVMVAEVLSSGLKAYEGKTIAAIAAAEKKDPRDVVIDIVLADRANASCILSIMDEQDVRTALAHPLVSFDCDSQGKAKDGPFAGETSHPRGWGSASRILGYYVREQKLLRLEEAVRKMTSLAAQAAGIPDRGLVKVGFRADLTLFDPDTVAARATFENPNEYSVGIPYVAVNGVLVVDEGRITDARPGQALRGPGYTGARPVH